MKFPNFLRSTPICIFCKRRVGDDELIYKYENVGVCKECNTALPLSSNGFFKFLGNEYNTLFAPFLYSGIFRKAFLDYKFNECKAYYHIFSYYMISLLEVYDSMYDGFISSFDLAITIPLSRERYNERTYNQCEIILTDIADRFNIKYEPDVLKRTRSSKRQSTLSAIERANNLRGLFIANEKIVQGKSIILFDDICTTGATIKNAYKALVSAGAKSIYPFALSIDDIQEHSKEFNLLMS